jgi:hypothetical protein
MRNELLGVAKSFALYLIGLALVTGLCFSGGYLGLTQAASVAFSFSSAEEGSDRTRLSIAVANAREIRAALAKAVAPPEPLGPIREKAANAMGGPKVVARQTVKPPKLSREAKNAFASGEAFASDRFGASSTAYVYDRHRPE